MATKDKRRVPHVCSSSSISTRSSFRTAWIPHSLAQHRSPRARQSPLQKPVHRARSCQDVSWPETARAPTVPSQFPHVPLSDSTFGKGGWSAKQWIRYEERRLITGRDISPDTGRIIAQGMSHPHARRNKTESVQRSFWRSRLFVAVAVECLWGPCLPVWGWASFPFFLVEGLRHPRCFRWPAAVRREWWYSV